MLICHRKAGRPVAPLPLLQAYGQVHKGVISVRVINGKDLELLLAQNFRSLDLYLNDSARSVKDKPGAVAWLHLVLKGSYDGSWQLRASHQLQ